MFKIKMNRVVTNIFQATPVVVIYSTTYKIIVLFVPILIVQKYFYLE